MSTRSSHTIKKVVLAYSGGLDTSVILQWLRTEYKADVIAFCADLGQGEDLRAVKDKALAVGAAKVYVEDLRETFVKDYVFPMLRANAVYEGCYLLGTSIARPLIARRQIEIAQQEKAQAVSHGATGKGNDQVRFELTYTAINPDIVIIAPWREWSFQSRGELIRYARKHGIPVTATKAKPYSMDLNLFHVSYEGGILEDPWKAPPESIFRMTVSPERAPDKPQQIEIAFERGDPVAVNGRRLSPANLLDLLNRLGGRHGIGRVDLVENRYVGIKSRGVYETPGGTILHAAHRGIESLTMDREVLHLRDSLISRYAELVYYGYWFAPEREMLQTAHGRSPTPRERHGPAQAVQRELHGHGPAIRFVALPGRSRDLRTGPGVPPAGCRWVYPAECLAPGDHQIPGDFAVTDHFPTKGASIEMNSGKRAKGGSRQTTAKGQPREVVPTKAWTGRFTEPTHASVERFTSSLPFDRGLFEYDILGSLAHCQALEKAKILTRAEGRALTRGLEQVRDELREDRFPFADSDEDIHMAVERRLTELAGPVGGKLHTGRSRNDQVTLDLRLYLRDHLRTLEARLQDLQRAFLGQAREHLDVIIPGYTHLQRAQPVSLAHHLLAYVEMLERDNARVRDACKRVNVMPLGSGALAGHNYPIDRAFIAKLLGFPALTRNSLDAVSDRDYVAETLGVLAIIMMHLSRLSEELVLWASQEFSFVELPDGFCTGSSMMPQKKNPDVPELIRGKSGRVYGHFLSIMTTLKGLPLSYNRDLQEDKEPLFDAMETVLECLTIYAELIRRLRVRRDVLSGAVEAGFLLATELADYLVNKGVPFREAHGIVGRLVRYCLEQRMEWQDLSLADLKAASPRFSKDALGFLTLEGAVDRKAQTGGTSRKQVTRQINAWEARLAKKPKA